MLNAAITQLLTPFNCFMKSAREQNSRLTTACPLRLIANGATEIYLLKEFVMLYWLGVPVVGGIIILLAEFFIIRTLKILDCCKETTEPDEGWYPGKLISKHFHHKALFFKYLIGEGNHQDLEEEPNADLDVSSFDQKFINRIEDNLKTLDGCKETTEPDEGWYPGKLISKHFHRKGLFFKYLIGKGNHQDLEEEPNADLDASSFDQKFINRIEDNLVKLVETFSQEDRAKMIVALVSIQKRSIPLLRSLSYHLSKGSEPLPIQISIDVLYALSRLSFRYQSLINRICNDAIPQLTPQVKSSLVRKLFNTIGHLKYRHEGLLEASSEWIYQNWNNIQSQDAVSLFKCLTTTDYVPSNWETLWPRLDKMIQDSSSQWHSSTQLDVIYSLAVLKQLKPTELPSLLNDTFIQQVLENCGPHKQGAVMKINQLWALAQLEKCELAGLTVEMPLKLEGEAPSPAPSSSLTLSVMEALSNFVPGKNYLRQNEQTALGLNIEGECILDSECVAVPLANHDQGQPLPADCTRIAIMVVDCKDQCLGSLTLTGTQSFRERLLTMSGYKVVKVSHLEFNLADKMVKKVQLLEQLIKNVPVAPQPNADCVRCTSLTEEYMTED